jgi:GAG-pre-integrase domain
MDFKGDKIQDAQGGMGKPIGMGTVVIQTGDAILKLEDVRHIPTLKTNLISAGLLEQQGFQVEKSKTSPSYYTIGTPDGDTIHATLMTGPNIYRIEIGKRSEECHDTYAYPAVTVPDISSTSTVLNEKNQTQYDSDGSKLTSETLTISEWHQRLGHLNQWDLLRLAKDSATGIKIKGTKTLPFCEICKQAHQTRTMSKTPMPRVLEPMMKIHIDLQGGGNTLGMKDDKGPKSRQGAHYALLITDDATRLRWVYFLAKKSDALGILKWWLSWMKNQKFPTPTFIRLDNELVTNESRQ